MSGSSSTTTCASWSSSARVNLPHVKGQREQRWLLLEARDRSHASEIADLEEDRNPADKERATAQSRQGRNRRRLPRPDADARAHRRGHQSTLTGRQREHTTAPGRPVRVQSSEESGAPGAEPGVVERPYARRSVRDDRVNAVAGAEPARRPLIVHVQQVRPAAQRERDELVVCSGFRTPPARPLTIPESDTSLPVAPATPCRSSQGDPELHLGSRHLLSPYC